MKEQKDHDLVSLKNKIAVITGGSNRTGRAIVERLAETNAQVIIADINLINAEIMVQAIANKYRTEAYSISLGVADSNAIASAMQTINQNWGPVDVWVNTSNLFHQQEAFDLKENELQQLVSVKMEEMFMSCREVARQMIKYGVEGTVINVITLKDFAALSGLPGLNEIERYMIKETSMLSEQFRRQGVRIFTIAPASKQSDPGSETMDTEFTLPDDLAMLVIFCISILSVSTTGKVIRLNGKNILINTKN